MKTEQNPTKEVYNVYSEFEYLGEQTNKPGHYQTIKSKKQLNIGQVVLDQNDVEWKIKEKM